MAADADAGIIHTVGSSTRQFPEFLGLLERYGITILADARIFSYRRQFPHFSRDALHAHVLARGLRYVHFGKTLGGNWRGGYEAYMQTAADP
jgi:uncharacterized protein (DUF488 family)